MIKILFSNLFITILISIMCGCVFLLPIYAISSLQPLTKTTSLTNEAEKTTPNKVMLKDSSNILRNSSNSGKTITVFNHPLDYFTPSTTTSWQLKYFESAVQNVVRRSVLQENIKIKNDFHFGISKSNQENNFTNNNNKKPSTHLLSDIKPINGLALLPSSTSPRVNDSTNSKTSASSYFERVELHESLTHTKNEKLQLHRNKRYLLFPEGSSFQLVFDLIIPIVDYTNFAIMGITCAVAWELPSKPPSEIIENFRTQLSDGTFGLSRRNDSTQQQLEYINSRRTEQEPVGGNKRWGEVGSTNYYPQYQRKHQQLSATATTTSGHEHFFTDAPQPPPLPPFRNSYYNNYNQRIKFQPSTAKTFFYNHPLPQQQQHWHNYYNFTKFDTNQRKKKLHANDNIERPMYRHEFVTQANSQNNNNNNYLLAHQPHPANKWNAENWQHQTKHQQPQQTKIPYNDVDNNLNKDNWWERNINRIEKHWQENQQKWSQYKENPYSYEIPMSSKRTGKNRKVLKKPPQHLIFPIFGKRRRRDSSAGHQVHSHNDDLAKTLQAIHTKEHLQTRQKLYGKIEKLYKTRGLNGTACVLRAICETAKMHLSATPQSFVIELLRTIFALPKDILTGSKDSLFHLNAHYIDAVLLGHDVKQSCTEQFHDCEHNIIYDT